MKAELEKALNSLSDSEKQMDEFRKIIEERETVIQDIVKNRNEIAAENEEIFNRLQQNEREWMEKNE